MLLLGPLAPHLAEELWSRLGHEQSLAYETFPVADPAWLVDDTVEVPVSVNGKVRSRITVAVDADAAALEAAARVDEKVAALLVDEKEQGDGAERLEIGRQLRDLGGRDDIVRKEDDAAHTTAGNQLSHRGRRLRPLEADAQHLPQLTHVRGMLAAPVD